MLFFLHALVEFLLSSRWFHVVVVYHGIQYLVASILIFFILLTLKDILAACAASPAVAGLVELKYSLRATIHISRCVIVRHV